MTATAIDTLEKWAVFKIPGCCLQAFPHLRTQAPRKRLLRRLVYCMWCWGRCSGVLFYYGCIVKFGLKFFFRIACSNIQSGRQLYGYRWLRPAKKQNPNKKGNSNKKEKRKQNNRTQTKKQDANRKRKQKKAKR